jgi:hypothetical protein
MKKHTAIKRFKKTASKKSPTKKVAKKAVSKSVRGYSQYQRGLHLPDLSKENLTVQIVKPSKLVEGIRRAKDDISSVVAEITSIPNVSAIEFTLGFSFDGKFMGFGLGGDTSVKITITPEE